MEYKQGQFGRFGIGDNVCFGFAVGPFIGKRVRAAYVLEKALEDGHDFCGPITPCHEPLPLEPSLEEWAKFMFLLAPEIDKVATSDSGSAAIIFKSGRKGTVGKFFPEEPYKTYSRTDFYPPETDWSQYIGHFGEFSSSYGGEKVCYYGYLSDYDLNVPKPFKMIWPCGLVCHYASFSPGLPPAKREESEATNE